MNTCHLCSKQVPAMRSPIADAQERASMRGVRLIMASIEPGASYVWYAPYLLIPPGTDNDTALGVLVRFFKNIAGVAG